MNETDRERTVEAYRAITEQPDPHAVAFTKRDGLPYAEVHDYYAKVDLVEFGITIYHHDQLDGSGPQLVIDIDNFGDDRQPIKIYRNDALVYDEMKP